MNKSSGYWWTSSPDEGWEGFAPSREEALKQIDECKYDFGDGDPMEIVLRPGYDSDDELQEIVFTGPSETIQISP